jgi:hypothetical protein
MCDPWSTRILKKVSLAVSYTSVAFMFTYYTHKSIDLMLITQKRLCSGTDYFPSYFLNIILSYNDYFFKIQDVDHIDICILYQAPTIYHFM